VRKVELLSRLRQCQAIRCDLRVAIIVRLRNILASDPEFLKSRRLHRIRACLRTVICTRPLISLTVARLLREPDHSPRESACWLSGHAVFGVWRVGIQCRSSAEVPRTNSRSEPSGFSCGEKYRVKSTPMNEQWQNDARYCVVVGWGWYYLISVLDDYHDFGIGLGRRGTDGRVDRDEECAGGRSFAAGPGFLAHAFEDCLRMLQIRHIRCAPHHPQTNGKRSASTKR
jgi:transposase InsO family protein